MNPTVFDTIQRSIEQTMALITNLPKDKTIYIGRELALVRTKLEEASLWLSKAENEQELKENINGI